MSLYDIIGKGVQFQQPNWLLGEPICLLSWLLVVYFTGRGGGQIRYDIPTYEANHGCYW